MTTAPPGTPAPLHVVPPGNAPSWTVLSDRFGRAFDMAVIVVVAGWHVAGAGSQFAADRARYSDIGVEIAAWLAFAAMIAVGSARLLSGSADRRWAWPLAGSAVLVSVVAGAGCPPSALVQTDWAWGTAGWVIVLILLRRPLRELCTFLAVESLVTFAVLAYDGLDRPDLATFLITLAGSAGIQLAVALAVRALDSVARQAAAATEAQATAREQAVIADQLHAARHARWSSLQETTGPLVRRLADGTADPADAEVRRQCAVEAARLRRLMAEGDESPNPLIHELQASADVAERRGVAVDIESAGDVPEVPAAIRRQIADVVIDVLASARSHARLTVTAIESSVVVSILADVPAPAERAAPADLTVDQLVDSGSLWLEVRWAAQ